MYWVLYLKKKFLVCESLLKPSDTSNCYFLGLNYLSNLPGWCRSFQMESDVLESGGEKVVNK
jgi:hypothetical protein